MTRFFGRLTAFFSQDRLNFSKIALVLAVAVATVYSYRSPFREVMERKELEAYDFRARMRSPKPADPRIVIIEIDQRTIERMGPPPWNNERYATMVRALTDMGADAIVFDVPLDLETSRQGDAMFAESIIKSGSVYLPVRVSGVQNAKAAVVKRPMESFSRGAAGVGHTWIAADPDGKVRRVRPRIVHEDESVLHLGLRAALGTLKADPEPRFKGRSMEFSLPGNRRLTIPLTQDGDLMLNWPARWTRSFRHVSFTDAVIAYGQWLAKEPMRVPEEAFKGSVCVVGFTANEMQDFASTPLEKSVPSAALTAAVLNSVLQRRFVNPLDEETNVVILCLLAAAVFVTVFASGFAQSLLRIVLLGIAYGALAFFSFEFLNVVLPVAYPFAVIAGMFVLLGIYHQFSTTIERKRLLRVVTKDPLTGLFNYAHFRLLLAAEIGALELRQNKSLSIAMIDIDYFKKVNDTYGHPAGDEVIRGVADIMRNNCRSLDVACRYGGEEFIMMFPGASVEEAGKVAERMRKAVEQRVFRLGPQHSDVTVTASFGVAAYYSKETAEDFVKRADRALYRAKDAGRNMVCRV